MSTKIENMSEEELKRTYRVGAKSIPKARGPIPRTRDRQKRAEHRLKHEFGMDDEDLRELLEEDEA